jgi:hypothetical protein
LHKILKTSQSGGKHSKATNNNRKCHQRAWTSQNTIKHWKTMYNNKKHWIIVKGTKL